MLKRILATAAFVVFAAPLSAQAIPTQQPKPAAPAGNEMTLTGQVVDVNCYVSLGASGPAHKACAAACAKAGVALAVLGSDGTLYMPVSSKPADGQNARLEPFAEGRVKITGTHRMRAGLHTIEIKTIEAAT